MKKRMILACVAASLMIAQGAALPVLAYGGYDVQVKFIKGEVVPKTPIFPNIELKRDLSGEFIGGMNNPEGIIDFRINHDIDVVSSFSSKTRKGDRYYVSIKMQDGNQYNIYNLDKAGINLEDSDVSSWFTIGEAQCLAFDYSRDGECTINKAETVKMLNEKNSFVERARKFAIKVYSDGQLLPVTSEPTVVNGRVYIPVRDLSYVCDLDLVSHEKGSDLSNKYGKGVNPVISFKMRGLDAGLYFPVNQDVCYTVDASGQESFQNGIGIRAINGKYMVPIDKLAGFSGLKMNWDRRTNVVNIESVNE